VRTAEALAVVAIPGITVVVLFPWARLAKEGVVVAMRAVTLVLEALDTHPLIMEVAFIPRVALVGVPAEPLAPAAPSQFQREQVVYSTMLSLIVIVVQASAAQLISIVL
jgi:hypothetical protein